MGIFTKKPRLLNEAIDVNAPFLFRIEDVFTISGKGRLFTGVVESGAVAIGAPATLLVGDRILLGQVKKLESRKERKPTVLGEGDKCAIELDGVETNDLPLRVYGGQMIVDNDALKGAVIRSRQASDIPPALRRTS
ncbi:hypothetical protein ACIQU8_25065 [Streptomyces griseus]|uniref:hypothetical protein n=1 Tax=Streptomyces griseus TaxID=1911 RepID=UPI0036CBB99C